MSENVKCLCKNPSQGRMERAIPYILWIYRKSNNGLITAVLNEVRLLNTGNSEVLEKIAWEMCGTSICKGL